MREIKFRGKRLDNGEWAYGSLVINSHMGDVRYYIATDGMAQIYVTAKEVLPATIGQFTGLTDKNGKEIYEGDIFKAADSNGECLVEVCWDEENARILGRDQRRRIWYVGREPRAEVIGNIHDHPELIHAHDRG